MRIVPARDVVPVAPSKLCALQVVSRPPEGETRRVCCAGDLGFSEQILAGSGGEPCREIAPVLKDADLAFANLETPLVGEVDPGAHFAAPASVAPLLAAAGFRLLNLANNHILDHGATGLAHTREALAAAGVQVLGAGPDAEAARRLVTCDLNGLTLGWLGCARTLQPQEPGGEGFWEYAPAELETRIRAARRHVDVLAVSIHMGYMFVDYPHPDQRRAVLGFLDAGADLVVMHHAHVLQGVEEVEDGGVACYSLGNLLFDWTAGEVAFDRVLEEQRSGGVFVFELDRRGVCAAAVLPTRVDDDWTVRWATGERGRASLERLRRISGDWREAASVFHRQLADRATGLAVHEAVSELRRGGLRAIPRLARRIRKHHLRMLAGWPVQRISRWLRPAR